MSIRSRLRSRFSALIVAAAAALPGCALGPPSVALSSSPEFEALSLPFSEAAIAGDTIYLSGQLGTRPGTVELVDGGVRAEARQALDNIRAVLERNGSALDRVVKCTVFLADMDEWAEFNAVYMEYFPAPRPARSAVGVDALALGARLELECIALVGAT